MFFDKGIASFHGHFTTSGDVIRAGARLLHDAGMVKDGYMGHVLRREEQFPTGIDTGSVGVALPHTDSQYVNSSQIAFLSLEEPVPFRYMANRDHIVPVRLVFMIAMKEAHEQVNTLSNLMGLLGDTDVLEKLLACSCAQELQEILAQKDIR